MNDSDASAIGPAIGAVPIELVVEGRLAIVIGAAGEAVSKIDRLVHARAVVRVYLEGGEVDATVREHAEQRRVELVEAPFRDEDARGAAVIFITPEHEAIGARLAATARTNGTLVSTLDRPESSTFINPAVSRGAGISLAISSGGAAPALVRELRKAFDKMLDDSDLARFVADLARARAEMPRGERSSKGRALLEGLRVRLEIEYPGWFTGK